VTTVQKKWPVTTLNGHNIDLLTEAESRYFNEARTKYLSEFTFTNASDLRDLDRLLLFEVQMFRWQTQLAEGVDYDGLFLDASAETNLRRSIKETAPMISLIQDSLGLTKAQRDKDQHESVGSYIVQLQQRAKEHGIRREKQAGKAIELLNQVFSMTGAYKRSNDKEKLKLGFESAEDIVDYILEVVRPEYDAIDAAYRATSQKFWVRTL
jgi:hypothetical protein